MDNFEIPLQHVKKIHTSAHKYALTMKYEDVECNQNTYDLYKDEPTMLQNIDCETVLLHVD